MSSCTHTSSYTHISVLRPKLKKNSIKSSFPLFPIFDLDVKRSRSTQDHHLNNSGIAGVPNATYEVSRQSVNWFSRTWLKVLPLMCMVAILVM